MVASVVCFGLPSQKGFDFVLGSERFRPCQTSYNASTRSGFLPPFHCAPEAERFRAGFDNVRAVRDPVQQRLTQSRIRKHRGPLQKGKFVVTMMAARSAISEIT